MCCCASHFYPPEAFPRMQTACTRQGSHKCNIRISHLPGWKKDAEKKLNLPLAQSFENASIDSRGSSRFAKAKCWLWTSCGVKGGAPGRRKSRAESSSWCLSKDWKWSSGEQLVLAGVTEVLQRWARSEELKLGLFSAHPQLLITWALTFLWNIFILRVAAFIESEGASWSSHFKLEEKKKIGDDSLTKTEWKITFPLVFARVTPEFLCNIWIKIITQAQVSLGTAGCLAVAKREMVKTSHCLFLLFFLGTLLPGTAL